MTNYKKWSDNPYAGESGPPTNPVTKDAGSWSLIFLKKDCRGNYLSPKGKKLCLPIRHPKHINFEQELEIVQDTFNGISNTEMKIAKYYGTGVPTKQWTPVIDRLIDTYGLGRNPTQAARIIATTLSAIQDTFIVVWDLKFRWNTARPNQYDQQLHTVICTPRFPAYPSGHATISGCASVVLSYFFPKEADKLHALADEIALSRLYGGIHFPSDNNEGLKLGRYIGRVIVEHLKTQRDKYLKPIDTPYQNFEDAAIEPIDFQQFIPFDFPQSCSSLVKDPFIIKKIGAINIKTKPKLFLDRNKEEM